MSARARFLEPRLCVLKMSLEALDARRRPVIGVGDALGAESREERVLEKRVEGGRGLGLGEGGFPWSFKGKGGRHCADE